MKYSKQREQICNILEKEKNHPTADMVYSAVKKENPKISLGTVYRNLSQLADAGMVRKLNCGSGSERFDIDVSRHGHFVCTNCGKITDVDFDEGMLMHDVKMDEGYRVENCDIVLTGLCSECAAADDKK